MVEYEHGTYNKTTNNRDLFRALPQCVPSRERFHILKGMENNEEVQIATVNTDAGMYQRVRIEVSATTLSATNLPTGLPSTLLAALSATIQLPALIGEWKNGCRNSHTISNST